MTDKYCCEQMKFAVEEWGGVEIDDNGNYYKIDRFDEGWDKTEICPWCNKLLVQKGVTNNGMDNFSRKTKRGRRNKKTSNNS